jgi:hypothetical protein
MIPLVQVVSAAIGIFGLFFAFRNDPPPWIVYVPVIFASSWFGTWLYVRLRYGRGVKVTPSRPK